MSFNEIEKYLNSKLIFSLPIYLRSQDASSKADTKSVKEYIANQEKQYKKFNLPITQNERCEWEIDFNRKLAPWKYNEIIGYLEIRILKNTLECFIFKAKAKRYRPSMSKKNILLNEYRGKIIKINKSTVNKEIVKDIKSFLVKFKKEAKKGKYFLETEFFDNICEGLNIKKLMC